MPTTQPLDPTAAIAALAGTEMGGADADAALVLVEQARQVSGFVLAAEAAALQRLAVVYPYPASVTTPEERRRAVAGEVAAAFGCSQHAASARVVRSERLVELPDLLDALKSGRVDVPRALMMIDKLGVLDTVAGRRAAAAVVLAAHDAAPDGLTMRQWAVLLGRAITAVDPNAADKRQAQTRADRGVRLHPPAAAGDAAALVIHGPGDQAAAAYAAINTLARAWSDTGRAGTLDQLRHDAANALLTGADTAPDEKAEPGEAAGPDDEAAPDDEAQPSKTTESSDENAQPSGRTGSSEDAAPTDDAGPGGEAGPYPSGDDDGTTAAQGQTRTAAGGVPPRPVFTVVLNLTMGLGTVVGVDEAPGELGGVGPIPASVARGLAARADTWRRILVDPVDGHVVTQKIRSYRPTEAMRQFVLARAGGVCAHRGCGHRAGLQLDHRDPWPHGPTTVGNFAPFHPAHHEDKTSRHWSYQLDPRTGAITQTTPAGRVYTTRPLPPAGATAQGQPPPTCAQCGSRVCPQCGSVECVPGELRAGYGCPACASDDYLASPPPDWTMLDEIHLQRSWDEQHQLTDHDLIAEINAEQLAELNTTPARAGPPEDPDP